MSSSKKISAEEILAERDQNRRMGLLAHTMNCRGDFMGRYDCSCYTCRDYFDPTGEEDARQRNATVATLSLPLPLPPKLERQNASCVACYHYHEMSQPCEPLKKPTPILKPVGIPLERSMTTGCPNSPHAPPPFPEWKPVCCQPSPPLQPTQTTSLPPPLSATRLNSIVGLAATSSGESTPQVEETYVIQEKKLIRRLEQMLSTYNELMEKLEKDEAEMNYRGHSEMAMMHDWWEEIDEKITATRALLKLLKSK